MLQVTIRQVRRGHLEHRRVQAQRGIEVHQLPAMRHHRHRRDHGEIQAVERASGGIRSGSPRRRPATPACRARAAGPCRRWQTPRTPSCRAPTAPMACGDTRAHHERIDQTHAPSSRAPRRRQATRARASDETRPAGEGKRHACKGSRIPDACRHVPAGAEMLGPRPARERQSCSAHVIVRAESRESPRDYNRACASTIRWKFSRSSEAAASCQRVRPTRSWYATS